MTPRLNAKVKIDAARKRYEERRELLLKRIEVIEHEGEAKLKLLQEQIAKTTGQAQANLEKRVAEERAKHNTRVAKLRQASNLVERSGCDLRCAAVNKPAHRKCLNPLPPETGWERDTLTASLILLGHPHNSS